MHTLQDLPTPSAVVDIARLMRNIETMQARMNALGVRFRPHVKTSKSLPVVQRQLQAGARGITVSTLKEAEQFFAAGISDILYAVGIAPNKLAQALELRRAGCELKLITDSAGAARAVAEFGARQAHAFEVWIEIDTDDHRAGIRPDDPLLLEVARTLHDAGQTLGGVMTHAGASYALNTREALVAMAEQERERCVRAAQRLRGAGLPCPNVSVGSTPTALSAERLDGVTEVRAGVYAFHDLVMANVGVCRPDDIALSVLTTVIGHQREKGWAIVDAGWMAMSRDRGTASQAHDYGYGQVCDLEGRPLPGWILSAANQEHGIVSFEAGSVGVGGADNDGGCDNDGGSNGRSSGSFDIVARLPVGTVLRVLPNHACATAAQFTEYLALGTGQPTAPIEHWPRFGGW